MESNSLMEESLARAFQLAYFIHGDRETALNIAAEALAKLEVAAAAQDKRLYYTPTGRAARAERFRTKVSVGELHLLQRLVYVESEPYERLAEQSPNGESPDEEDMLIHFIKHLVRITVRRNSFYVTLGLSRLLHNYSTAETMEMYNILVQDPGRVRDDYYYRSRKGRLMKELKERFGDLLRVARGARGEERFQSDGATGRHALALDGVSLLAVKKVYVDPFGDDPIGKQFRDQLTTALLANRRFTLSTSRDEADAVLKGKLTTTRPEQVSVTLRLVNAKGDVLWPVKGHGAGKQYQGPVANITGQIARDLLDDMAKAERK